MSQIELNNAELNALEQVNILPDTTFVSLDTFQGLSPENREKLIKQLEQTSAGGKLLQVLKEQSTNRESVTTSTKEELKPFQDRALDKMRKTQDSLTE